MGDICYSCKNKLKWGMKKFSLDKITDEFNKVPPSGFTSNDNLCKECFEKLLTVGSPESIARAEKEVKEGRKNALESSGVVSGECYWCKKFKETEDFCNKSDWIYNGHPQCIECNQIISKLTSVKMKELRELEYAQQKKLQMLHEQERDTTYAKSRADFQKYADVLTGSANAGIAGIAFPNSNTQFTENSANQNKSSLKIQIFEVEQERKRLQNLITDEKLELAKNHLLNKDIKQKSVENEPLQILKTRYAKGEITREEFEQMKKDLS